MKVKEFASKLNTDKQPVYSRATALEQQSKSGKFIIFKVLVVASLMLVYPLQITRLKKSEGGFLSILRP